MSSVPPRADYSPVSNTTAQQLDEASELESSSSFGGRLVRGIISCLGLEWGEEPSNSSSVYPSTTVPITKRNVSENVTNQLVPHPDSQT